MFYKIIIYDAWGYNGNGQLGLGNNINQLNACKITNLQGIVITKVQIHIIHFNEYASNISINFTTVAIAYCNQAIL